MLARNRDAGLIMTLRRIKGVTKKGVLDQPLQFQIAPLDTFGWDVSYSWNDYDTISAGQFSRPGGRQLRSLTISTLAMDYNPPWAVAPYRPDGTRRQVRDDFSVDPALGPWKLSQRLDKLVVQGTPMLLVVGNPGLYDKPDIQMPVTLRSASLRERAGEPDARYFELTLTEWRRPKVNRRQYGRHPLPAVVLINKEGVALEIKRGGDKLKEEQRHKIGSKSSPATLRKLSKHYYGTPNKWKRIAKRNNVSLKGLGPDDSLEKLWERRRHKVVGTSSGGVRVATRKGPVRLHIPGGDSDDDDRGKQRSKKVNSGGVRP